MRKRSRYDSPHTSSNGGITVEVYTVGVSGIPNRWTESPSAIPAARSFQVGFMIAAQHSTATNVFALKCFEAVIAIKIGRNVNGVHDMNDSTWSVPVSAKAGNSHRVTMSAPWSRPAAAKM